LISSSPKDIFSFYNYARNPLQYINSTTNLEELNFPESLDLNFNLKKLIFKVGEACSEVQKEDFLEESNKTNNLSEALISNSSMFLDPVSENQLQNNIYNQLNSNSGLTQIYSNSSVNNNNKEEEERNMFEIGLEKVEEVPLPTQNFNLPCDNYEDFNNFDDLGGGANLYTYDSYQNNNSNNFNQNNLVKFNENYNPNSVAISSESIYTNIINNNTSFRNKTESNNSQDSYQILSVKQNSYNNNQFLNEKILPNHQKIKEPHKLITKEYFSQQVNSLGNIQSQPFKNPDLIDLENKLGVDENSIGCPDYDSFSEERLKDEMKKYGLKPASNKFMIKHLKEIWNFVNLSKYK
jgi:hypothetical protein